MNICFLGRNIQMGVFLATISIHFELSFCCSNVLGFAEGERIVREARQGRARGRRQERARQAAERYQGADGHQGHRGADGQVLQLCNFP